jgi:hypothetical protein
MRGVSVFGRIFQVLGAVLLLVAVFLGLILFQRTPGAWFGDFHSLAQDVLIYLSTLGLIGVAAILLGFRLVRRGAAGERDSASSEQAGGRR